MVQFGIWELDENFGLIGRPQNFPEVHLSSDRIWDIEEKHQGQIWKWPIQLAQNSWFSPRVADDFNKTFFYAHKLYEGLKPITFSGNFDIDARTVQLQTEMLSDYFPGPDDEISLWVQ